MNSNIVFSGKFDELHRLKLAAIGAPSLEVPVQIADEASSLFTAYRDRYGLGASDLKSGCGDIYDSANSLVGRISYNGRIWDANSNPVD